MNSIHGYMIYDLSPGAIYIFQVVPKVGRYLTFLRPGLAFFLQPLASQEEGNDGKAGGAENILRNFQSQEKGEAVCETTLIPLKPLK